MNKKIVAVDCGKADTKVYAYDTKTGGIKHKIIRSKVEPVNELVRLTLGEDAHVVKIKKSDKEISGEWTVGAIGGDTSYSNSKKDAIHKIMTLTAIALTVDNGDAVIASIGCPLSVFGDDTAKAEYYEYMFPNGRVDMEIDGNEHYFYIEKDKCMVFPESFGALFLFEDKFTQETGIVDIGGLNVNASYFYDGVLDPYNSKTEKLGYYSLISVLRNRLNALCDASFNDTAVELYLKQGYVTGSKESAKVIEDVLRLHVERIEKLLKMWDLPNMTLIFIGGTSKLLQKQIEACFGKKAFIPDDANIINSKGFLRAMLNGLGYKSPV